MSKILSRRRSALFLCASTLAIANLSTPSQAEQQLFYFYVNGLNGGNFQTGNSASYNGPAFDTNRPTGPGDPIDQNTLPGGFYSSSSAPGALSDASGNGHGTAGNLVTGSTAIDAFDGYGGIGLEGMTHFGGMTVTRNVEVTHGPGGATTGITSVFTAAGLPNAARWIDTFTNTTGATVSGTLAWANNLGSDNNTRWVAAGPNNTYLVSVQATGNDPVITYVFGNNAYTQTQVVLDHADGDDNPSWKYAISVAPGETIRLAHFVILTADINYASGNITTKTADIALGEQLAKLLTSGPLPINSPFFTGYSAAELLTIRNFSFAMGMPQATAQSLATISNAVPAQITGDILTELSNLRVFGDTDPSGFASSSMKGAAKIMLADASSPNTMTDVGAKLFRIASADDRPALGNADGSTARRAWAGNGWRAFGLVSGFTGRRGAEGTVAGLTYDGFSATLGADYLVTPQTRLGGALSYAQANSDVSSSLGNSDVSTYAASIYMSHSFTPALYLDAVGLLGWNEYKYDRVQGPDTAHGDSDGLSYGLNVTTGFNVPVTPSAKVGPYLSLSYTENRIAGYTETGAGIGNLQVDTAHIRAGSLEAGAKASYKIEQGWGTLVPEVKLGVKGGVGDSTSTLTAQFVGTPSSLTASTFRTGSGTALVTGVGVAANLSNDLELKLAYNGTYGHDTEHNSLSLRAILRF